MTDVQQPAFPISMEITGDHEEELQDAMDYLRARLLGQIPAVFTDFAAEVSRVLWEGYAREGVVIRLVGEDGEPIGDAADRTPEEIAREAEQIESYFAWTDSPEGQAELGREERFHEFKEAHASETAELYSAWLEKRAEQFHRAKREWRRTRDAALRERFDSTDLENNTKEETNV